MIHYNREIQKLDRVEKLLEKEFLPNIISNWSNRSILYELNSICTAFIIDNLKTVQVEFDSVEYIAIHSFAGTNKYFRLIKDSVILAECQIDSFFFDKNGAKAAIDKIEEMLNRKFDLSDFNLPAVKNVSPRLLSEDLIKVVPIDKMNPKCKECGDELLDGETGICATCDRLREQ